MASIVNQKLMHVSQSLLVVVNLDPDTGALIHRPILFTEPSAHA
jgi:hypothetical protein